jgi:hypothetical protein
MEIYLLNSFLITLTLGFAHARPVSDDTITITGAPMGRSFKEFGISADPFSPNFRSFEISASLLRFSVELPSISTPGLTALQVKESPNLVPWADWDVAMNRYRKPFAELTKTGSGVLIVLPLPPMLNARLALQTPEQRNAWWIKIYAFAKWLNVRNRFGWNRFELPISSDRVSSIPETDYIEALKIVRNALEAAFAPLSSHFLLLGPAAPFAQVESDVSISEGKGLVYDVLETGQEGVNVASAAIDGFGDEALKAVREIHDRARAGARGPVPVWVTSWNPGSKEPSVSASTVISTMIRLATPGENHVDGLVLDPTSSKDASVRNAASFALKALGRATSVYRTASTSGEVVALATRDEKRNLYVLITNTGQVSHSVNLDLQSLLPRLGDAGFAASLYRYQESGTSSLDPFEIPNSRVAHFDIKAGGAQCLKISPPL